MVALVGPPATLNCEPRQARKGATVAVAACAGMWLAGAASILSPEITLLPMGHFSSIDSPPRFFAQWHLFIATLSAIAPNR